MESCGDGSWRPARTEVRRYLSRIEARLQMPPSATDAILDELASHLHDAIESAVHDGMTREDAERAALERLGSPEALGDELRRTHQTTRRLLAAVGGGVFQGLRGGVRGWFGGSIASIPLFVGIGLVAQLFVPQAAEMLGTSFSPLVLCSLWGAAWLGGRYLVEHISAKSLRSVERVRIPVTFVGATAIAIAVLVLPMDQTILSMGMTLVLPLVFAAGALTTDAGLGAHILDLIWRDSFPTVRRVLFVAFASVALGGSLLTLAVAAIVGPSPTPLPEAAPSFWDLPATERWAIAGYGVVAPRMVASDTVIAREFERDGALVVRVPRDVVDWDDWSNVRFEAWEATRRSGGDRYDVRGSAPYEIVPVTDPWATHGHVVRVGQPGISHFVVFLIAQDSETGERVAIGWPEGQSTTFHGTVLDWFSR